MRKKAQVTTFVIIGLILLVLIALGLYMRGGAYIFSPTTDDLNLELSSIKRHILACMQEAGKTPILEIGKQGGFLEPLEDTYRLYAGSNIAYLCFNMEGTDKCRSRILLKKDLATQLSGAIDIRLKSCINIDALKKGGAYDVLKSEEWKIDTVINKDDVIVSLDYLITLKSLRSEAVAKGPPKFTRVFNYPLGDLYDVSRTVLDGESGFGDFDPLPYMLFKKGEYKIEKNRPYPDKVYKITRMDSDYVFQFGIEGEAS